VVAPVVLSPVSIFSMSQAVPGNGGTATVGNGGDGGDKGIRPLREIAPEAPAGSRCSGILNRNNDPLPYLCYCNQPPGVPGGSKEGESV
jgi:hypothetical protein